VREAGTTVDPAFACPARDGDYFSYWRLHVVKGDVLTIDWGAQQKGTALSLFPVGTTDATVAAAQPLESQPLEEMYGLAELNAAPQPRTGPIVLQVHGQVCDGGGGPYDFTAHVRHAVRLRLPSRAPGRRLTVAVRAPDGAALAGVRVTVQVRRHGAWRRAGSAKASHGRAVVRLAAWVHGRVRLRAAAAGSGFIGASAARTVRVQG